MKLSIYGTFVEDDSSFAYQELNGEYSNLTITLINKVKIMIDKLNICSPEMMIRPVKYLNEYSTSGKFDEALSEKLFQFLNINDSSSFSIEHFIGGFMQFEEDISSNLTQLKQKLEEKKEEYENLISTIKTRFTTSGNLCHLV